MTPDYLEACGVPARVARAVADGVFIETEAVGIAREWRSSDAGVLVLCGAVGCGKSVAATWLLKHNEREKVIALVGGEKHRVVERMTGAWVAASALVEASDFSSEFWKPLRRASLLVVDEVGTERLDAKGRAVANFTELIRRRYDDGRRTVITTNLPPAEWLNVYGSADGGRLRDRLKESEFEFGRPAVVALSESSLRCGGRR
jgi:DNA replication protein DnaC